MKTGRYWKDEPEIFEVIVNYLDTAQIDYDGILEFNMRDEQDGYGDNHYIRFQKDGRTFQLELTEIF